MSKENLRFFSLSYNNEKIIILCTLLFNKRLYAFYVGITTNKDILRLKPVDLFYWEVICWAKRNHFDLYDWLGAGRPNAEYGVRKFKLEYGGNLVEYGRFQIVHSPILMNIATMGLKILQNYRFLFR